MRSLEQVFLFSLPVKEYQVGGTTLYRCIASTGALPLHRALLQQLRRLLAAAVRSAAQPAVLSLRRRGSLSCSGCQQRLSASLSPTPALRFCRRSSTTSSAPR